MQVFKIEQPLVAFKFVATDKGNNFDELSADVVAAGGTVEQLGDALALVRGVGAEVQLPLGFGVVYDGGVGRVMPVDVLDSQYVVGAGEFDLDDLVARLEKVEKAVASGKGRATGKAEKTAGDGTE
jgi:hypothetical protein